MTGETYLVIKASRSLKSDITKDKPYYKVADVTPVGIPSAYLEKWTPFVYETIRVERPTANMIESFTVKVESEDQLYSTVRIADWSSHPSTAQEKLVELVNAVAAEAKRENKHIKPQWLYEEKLGFRGAVVKGLSGCVWVDVVGVEIKPLINYGDVMGEMREEIRVAEERMLGQDGH